MELQTPRGTKDIYGEAAIRWQKLEGLARDLCARNGMGEIRTPMFEHTELFVRGVGEGTDVVQKEMYTFTD
ncbi:MAG: histidine--tRNA ligase, partial [Clostridiales bacterium]|nr:histidine--tRNA ligase [Clostridiales bacterium]